MHQYKSTEFVDLIEPAINLDKCIREVTIGISLGYAYDSIKDDYYVKSVIGPQISKLEVELNNMKQKLGL